MLNSTSRLKHCLTRAAIIAFMLLGVGCASVSVDEYSTNSPQFNPEEFFAGPLVATGMIKNRGGRVTRRFVADINASWKNGVGTLDEEFVFDDGEVQRRVWTLTPVDGNDGAYVATAGDVVGDGQARTSGNAMFLKYTLRVPYGDDTIDLSIDDRMYLVTPKLLLNESVMRKFGFRVGEIVLSIEKQ